MQIQSAASHALHDLAKPPAALNGSRTAAEGDAKVKEVFSQFVGETFFNQLIKGMRTTQGKPAYFHGGRAEEVFQGQLDQVLTEKMTESTADQWTGPMFELFQLQRR